MVPYDLFFYSWLFTIALPGGACIGVLTGWLTKKLLREPWRSVSGALLDGAIGAAGFVLGALVAVASTSFIYEESYNGKLVTRRTDGFGDYIYLFAIVGAIALVVIVRLSISLARKLICKSSINGDKRMDTKA